jgi:hypothetical protein
MAHLGQPDAATAELVVTCQKASEIAVSGPGRCIGRDRAGYEHPPSYSTDKPVGRAEGDSRVKSQRVVYKPVRCSVPASTC